MIRQSLQNHPKTAIHERFLEILSCYTLNICADIFRQNMTRRDVLEKFRLYDFYNLR